MAIKSEPSAIKELEQQLTCPVCLDTDPKSSPCHHYLAKHTSLRTIDGLNKPCGVAVSDDEHVIVTENQSSPNCITVLDKEGKKVKSYSGGRKIKFISTNFSMLRSVAITSDNFILVTDDHRIQKLTMDGKLIASVGQQGSKPLEF